MPSPDELDLLARARPTILDRAPTIMDEVERDQLLQRILESDLAGPPATSGRRVSGERPRAFRVNQGRRRLALGVAAVAALALVALVSVPVFARSSGSTPGVAASDSSLHWQLVSDVSGPWRPLATISPRPDFQIHCASATTCYALGSDLDGSNRGQLLVTTDSGESWQPVNLPAHLGWNGAMSCVGASTCAILGMKASGATVFVETSDGGRSWSSHPGPSQLDSSSGHATSVPAIAGLACTSVTHCTAVAAASGSVGSSSAFTTSDSGAAWSESTVPVTVEDSAGLNMSPLQCQSSGACIVAGFTPGSDGEALSAGYSTDGGASWQAASVPAGTFGVASISCPETDDCLMVSYGGGVGTSTVLHSTDSGRSWSLVSPGGLPRSLLTGISCPSSADCWTSGGTTGPSFPRGQSKSLLALSTDNGQTWQQATLPSGISAVEGVSCPTANACYALALRQMRPGDITFVLLRDTSN
jgi:photosystem II stability/assembly factor-like uncharacterized protein